jgi:hypothetical protein
MPVSTMLGLPLRIRRIVREAKSRTSLCTRQYFVNLSETAHSVGGTIPFQACLMAGRHAAAGAIVAENPTVTGLHPIV